ncbi:sucrose-phosphate synthase [Caldanaerobius fijiensis DSM 17918]|uniref:sucrose-phosphate synthase n=1 Tax=Caldanaerobius fijiensis DSM 17918 TaxID=1121256 RepID=A0A1M5AHR9_9THEO|nr:glycosyltransferase [Caldanaerobius fijiensis]SHF29839.1 sucrose-phosphate synthase [Caldanaerobius fijiensis DSM 17918]
MHIAFFNPQGNFDRKDSHWTEHPDFGGQLVYVKEVAIAIAKQGHRVDIITRKIDDPDWPEFKETLDHYDGIENINIIRIPCGPASFLPKEQLWQYLNEWVDNILLYYRNEGSMPDFVTTHYGDGGIAGALFKEKTGIPFSFTAHSLGAQKMDKLKVTPVNFDEMENKYRFSKRILAERTAMLNSSIIYVSTSQEMDEQYVHPLYKGAGDVNNPEKFRVVPPGVNTKIFSACGENPEEDRVRNYVKAMFERDLDEGRRGLPAIVVSSRLDPKKNHVALVKAYAESKELQGRANLVITLRGIENAFADYSKATEEEKKILDEIMAIIRENDLMGKVSMFSINGQDQLAACYRELARRRSVFCLTAVYEPFGLAPIEAMSCGLPAVVTKYGGPSDVLYENGKRYGVLIDVFDLKDIARGLVEAFDNYEYYKKQGMHRVASKYTWDATANGYLDAIVNMDKNDFSSNVEVPYWFKNNDLEDNSISWLRKNYFGR